MGSDLPFLPETVSIQVKTDSGSTLRIGVPRTGEFALYAHCRNTIITNFVAAFPRLDRVEGKRAILFSDPSRIEPARHAQLIAHALRYHL